MKQCKLTRIFALFLSLLMLFAVVACDNGGLSQETVASTAAATTTAITTGATTAITTGATSAITTEATTAITTGATTSGITASKTSASVTRLPDLVSGEPGSTAVYTFYNYLPERFAGKDAILLRGEDHLADDLGVTSLVQTYGDVQLTHYYINASRLPDDIYIPIDQMCLTWKLTAPEAGTYEICFNLRIKARDDVQRAYVMTVDGGAPTKIKYHLESDEQVATVSDVFENSYMTGVTIELAPGEHTLQFKFDSSAVKGMHIRNIYLVKTSS